MMIRTGLLLFLLFASVASAGELDEVQKELQAVQARIAEEEARYQAAKAAMERSQIIAQYVFPELRLREKQLMEKIQTLSAAANPDSTAKGPRQ